MMKLSNKIFKPVNMCSSQIDHMMNLIFYEYSSKPDKYN